MKDKTKLILIILILGCFPIHHAIVNKDIAGIGLFICLCIIVLAIKFIDSDIYESNNK